jgi:hypothetical protein
MLASWWHNMNTWLGGERLALLLLWTGMATLSIALLAMIWTRWGQSHPLRKCAALSLLAHLLLAGYAAMIEIVTASGGPIAHAPVHHLTLADDPPDAWEEPEPAATRPWEAAAATPPTPEAVSPPRPEPEASDLEPANPTPEPLDAAAVAPIISDPLPVVMPTQSAAHPVAQPAEAIDAPAPQAETPPADPAEPPASPDRPELAALDIDRFSPPTPSRNSPLASDTAGSLTQLPDPATTDEPDRWLSGPLVASPAPTTPVAASPLESPRTAEAASADTAAASNTSEGSPAPPNTTDHGPPLVPLQAVAGPARVPELFRDRVAQDRAAVARSRGGSPQAEAAVQAALRWLAANQSPNGRWEAQRFGAGQERHVLGHDRRGAGAKADTAMTGLALLAFLGAGHTHQQGDYTPNVRRGIDYLVGVQGRDGNLGGQAELFAFMYCHGMAALALSEAYAMTGDERLKAPVTAAVRFTLAAQHPTTGGWRYQPREQGDTSQLGWQLMALKSAELAGIAMPDEARDGAVGFLKSVGSGRFGGRASYRPGERASRPMTAEALVCRQFLGMARDNPAADEAGDYLLEELPSADRINLYYWYYGTLGMYQLQGRHWELWNEALQDTLLRRQITSGDLAGSWDPDCVWGGYGGRVYSTAMAALCLEVYYRYLPLYQQTIPQVASPR